MIDSPGPWSPTTSRGEGGLTFTTDFSGGGFSYPHGWNFPGLDGSVNFPQSSIIIFTQCDPLSEIITADSYSLSEILWVTTLRFLGCWGGVGGCDLNKVFSRGGFSLPNPFLVVCLCWWLDYGISIDSTFSNHYLCHVWERHTEGIRFSDEQWWGWSVMGSMISTPLCLCLLSSSYGKLLLVISWWATGATEWRREMSHHCSLQLKQEHWVPTHKRSNVTLLWGGMI